MISNKRKKPLISVNVRTYNSAKTLEKTLKSIKNQTYKNLEIIVSDGYSKDSTIDIAKKFDARIHYVRKLGDARYKDIKISKGEYILSLDSDQIMDNDLIEKCVSLSNKNNYGALIISEKSLTVHNSFLEKLIAFDKHLIDKSREGSQLMDNACPRFFKRKDLLKIPWPKQLSIFDDAILYAMLRKNNVRIGYLGSSSIWHHEVGSWKILIKKFFRYGKGYLNALDASPKVVALHSLPRRSYFSKYVFEKPFFIIPLFVLYFVKAASASAGLLYSLFERFLTKIRK